MLSFQYASGSPTLSATSKGAQIGRNQHLSSPRRTTPGTTDNPQTTTDTCPPWRKRQPQTHTLSRRGRTDTCPQWRNDNDNPQPTTTNDKPTHTTPQPETHNDNPRILIPVTKPFPSPKPTYQRFTLIISAKRNWLTTMVPSQ